MCLSGDLVNCGFGKLYPNFVCVIFAYLEKAFGLLDHKALTKKLNNFDIWGLSNQWFHPYLSNKKSFISINE